MNKTTEALKLAENLLLRHQECYEYPEDYVTDEVKALSAIREALAEPVKQEPVAWYIFDKDLATTDSAWAAENEDMCDPLYRAPVDAKAIRAEALEEAAKVCDELGENGYVAEGCAAAIRGLK